MTSKKIISGLDKQNSSGDFTKKIHLLFYFICQYIPDTDKVFPRYEFVDELNEKKNIIITKIRNIIK